MVAPIKEFVCGWTVNGSHIHVNRHGDTLKYRVTDKDGTIKESIPIQEGSSTEVMIEWLKNCRVILQNWTPHFLPYYHTWQVENREISLLRGNNGLVWNIFCKATNTSTHCEFEATTRLSLRCREETIQMFEEIKNDFSRENILKKLIPGFSVSRYAEMKIFSEGSLCQQMKHEISTRTSIMEFFLALRFYCGGMILSSILSSAPIPDLNLGLKFELSFVLSSASILILMLLEKIFGTKKTPNLNLIRTYTLFGIQYTIFNLLNEPTDPLFIRRTTISVTALAIILTLQAKICELKIKKTKEIFTKKIEFLSSQNRLMILLEPVHASSYFDKRVSVTMFNWAITVITNGGRLGNHTKIFIEGINNGFFKENSPKAFFELKNSANSVARGEKFTYLAHLLPGVDSGLYPPDSLPEYSEITRTEIWIKPTEIVETLIANIEAEKNSGIRTPFNIRGIDSSIGNRGDNCFTWSREHLRSAGIILGKSRFGIIATIPKNFTKKPSYYLSKPVDERL